MFMLVPITNGDLDVDYTNLREAIQISATQAIAKLDDNAVIRPSWIVQNQTDWDSVTAPNLNDTKASKRSELQQSYHTSFTVFQSSATGTSKTYPIDDEAQQNMRDYQQRAVLDTAKDIFWFKTIQDGTLIQHTRAQFLQLVADAETFKVNQTLHYDSLIAQVNAATNTASVEAITW